MIEEFELFIPLIIKLLRPKEFVEKNYRKGRKKKIGIGKESLGEKAIHSWTYYILSHLRDT